MDMTRMQQVDYYVLRDAINDLHAFAAEAHAAAAPYHHTYVRSLVNSIQPMLGTCMVLARTGSMSIISNGSNASFDFTIAHEETWEQMMALVHRAFYAGLLTTVEAMCDGYCKTKAITVTNPSDPTKGPEFRDYLETALTTSNIADKRKKHWRKYFEAIRIMRNKASHFHGVLTAAEQQKIRDAGLQHHLDPGGQFWTNAGYYRPLVESALSLVRELDGI